MARERGGGRARAVYPLLHSGPAIQYVRQIDDPTRVPDEVRQLIGEMDHALNEIQSGHDLSVAEAERRIDAVVAAFQPLAGSLRDQRQEAHDDDGPGRSR